MARKYIAGGPSNSGKSTYILSVMRHLREARGLSATAIELDVWSGSYPAFAGEVSFKDRPKKFGLDWDWKTPLHERLRQLETAAEDIAFGDMPGAKIDEATHHMCEAAKPFIAGAIVISRTIDGLKEWRALFEGHGIPVVHECLTFQGRTPLILRDMNRNLDPLHPDVALLAAQTLGDEDPHADRRTRAMERRFETVFKLNYMRRSRTAMGKDENAVVAADKKPLMLLGEDLKLKAMSNWVKLTKDIQSTARPAKWDAEFFRAACERWFDLANAGIYGPEWYEEEIKELTEDAALVARARGLAPRVNPRYRLWTPEHTLMKVPPLLLEEEMDRFYARLAELVAKADARFPSWSDTLEAMAYADLMIDGELRPWLDGCGRVAATLVMWIARTLGAPLPLFDTSKEVHKMTIRDLDRHTGYFLKCIRRAEAEIS